MATIRKRGTGWQARIAKKGFPILYRTFDTKSDATAWAQENETNMSQRKWRDHRPAEQTSLSDILERYRKEITPTKKGAIQEHSRIGVILRHAICLKSLSALSTSDIATYRDDRLEVVGNKTVKDELGYIRRIIHVAQTDWGISLPSGNPADFVTKPKVSNARNRRLTLEEYTQLVAGACKSGRSRVLISEIIVLAVETALRRGEIVSLDWQYVNLDTRTLHLPHTKNGEARDVPLSSIAIGVFKTIGVKTKGRVFDVTGDGITQAFERVVKNSSECFIHMIEEKGLVAPHGFLANLRFHDLRHEATSRLAKIFQPHELAKITGHKTIQMIMRYYHPTAEDLANKLL